MEKVTLIYLNWKRNNQLLKIIEDAKKQSINPKIVVIDNSAKDEKNKINPTDVIYVESDNTNQCWERWLYVDKVDTKYICVMDDDLTFTDTNTLENCYKFLEENLDVDCVGYAGVMYDKNKDYWSSKHYHRPSIENLEIPIIKGRFMFIRTESLVGLDKTPDLTCDDIKVCGHLSKKILLNSIRMANLKEGDEAVFKQKGQHNKRIVAAKKYLE